MSGSFPARIPRKPTHRWIPIQPLNVGDKGVAKSRWRHALITEASRACLRRVNMYCCDLTRRNKVIGGIEWGYQNPPFSPEESKSKILRDYCGDKLTPEVLFKLRGLGLWPNNPVRGREHIRGQPVKEKMKIVLWEEVKYIYGEPNRIWGECSSRNFCPRWLETFSSP